MPVHVGRPHPFAGTHPMRRGERFSRSVASGAAGRGRRRRASLLGCVFPLPPPPQGEAPGAAGSSGPGSGALPLPLPERVSAPAGGESGASSPPVMATDTAGPGLAPPGRPRPRPQDRPGPLAGAATRHLSFGAVCRLACACRPVRAAPGWSGEWGTAGLAGAGLRARGSCSPNGEGRGNRATGLEVQVSCSEHTCVGNGLLVLLTGALEIEIGTINNNKKKKSSLNAYLTI